MGERPRAEIHRALSGFNLACAPRKGFARTRFPVSPRPMRPSLSIASLLILPLAALVSCAAPKAVVVEEPASPTPAPAEESETPVVADAPATPAVPDDGIRLPDMLGLPGDSEFKRPTAASAPASSSGAVIARPPVNPPAQP